MREKILHLQQQLNQGLVGRGEALRAALLALVAGENALLIGPPGTAKSLLARRLSEVIAPEGDQPAYFEYLLTKFSTPEELFGPLSLSALKQDRFQRNTQGYLPTVQVAFLDEIFKASSSILNSLLTILNERKFHNGTEAMQVPLQSLVAASNELPRGQPELAALYDRFLIRRHVDYLEPEKLAELFAPQPAATVDRQNQLTVTELAALRQQAAAVVFPAEIQQAVREIWREHGELFREHAEERLSDRRFVKVVHLLRIAAASNGRKEVDLSDLVLLKDCLWSDEANAPRVHELVMTVVRKYDRVVPLKGEGKKPLKVQAVKAAPKPAGQVIKGLKGSGTVTDPFLIENLNHLLRLAQPEVGQQGYCFRQTADIDATAVDSWPVIDFKGFFDGVDFEIKYKNERIYLFGEVGDSKLIGINLTQFRLAKNLINSKISHCKTDSQLLGVVVGSEINSSTSTARALARCSENSKFRFCASGSNFIEELGEWDSGQALDCVFENCLIIIVNNNNEYRYNFGISRRISNTMVEKCFVTVLVSGGEFLGIVNEADEDSKISACVACAVGTIDTWLGRYFRITGSTKAMLNNNIALDTLSPGDPAQATPNGLDGQSVSAAAFNQYYFEHNLGWDFDTVWQWNDAENRPELRPQPRPDWAMPAAAEPLQVAEGQTSLLLQQLQANIWLRQG